MVGGLHIPTLGSGYARNEGQAHYAHLWRGMAGAWCPFLGNTGRLIHDRSHWLGTLDQYNDTYPAVWQRGALGDSAEVGVVHREQAFQVLNTGGLAHTAIGYSEFSIAAWVSQSGTPTTLPTLLYTGGNTAATSGWLFGTYAAHDDLRCYLADGVNQVSRNSDNGLGLADGKYHMIAATIRRSSGTVVQFYADGRPVGTTSTGTVLGAVTNSTGLYLSRPATGANWQGCIAFVAIWRRCLPTSEIQDLWSDPFALMRKRYVIVPKSGAVAPINFEPPATEHTVSSTLPSVTISIPSPVLEHSVSSLLPDVDATVPMPTLEHLVETSPPAINGALTVPTLEHSVSTAIPDVTIALPPPTLAHSVSAVMPGLSTGAITAPALVHTVSATLPDVTVTIPMPETGHSVESEAPTQRMTIQVGVYTHDVADEPVSIQALMTVPILNHVTYLLEGWKESPTLVLTNQAFAVATVQHESPARAWLWRLTSAAPDLRRVFSTDNLRLTVGDDGQLTQREGIEHVVEHSPVAVLMK